MRLFIDLKSKCHKAPQKTFCSFSPLLLPILPMGLVPLYPLGYNSRPLSWLSDFPQIKIPSFTLGRKINKTTLRWNEVQCRVKIKIPVSICIKASPFPAWESSRRKAGNGTRQTLFSAQPAPQRHPPSTLMSPWSFWSLRVEEVRDRRYKETRKVLFDQYWSGIACSWA